jgi:ketosteroid isomerase-like protein
MTTTNNPLATVRRMFEAFGNGDLDGLLETVHPDSHPGEFVTENDTIVVFGFESGTVKATGNPFRKERAQKYVVRDDLITEMEVHNIQVNKAS